MGGGRGENDPYCGVMCSSFHRGLRVFSVGVRFKIVKHRGDMSFYVFVVSTFHVCRSRVVPESCLGVGSPHLRGGEFEVTCRGESKEESDEGGDEYGSGDA